MRNNISLYDAIKITYCARNRNINEIFSTLRINSADVSLVYADFAFPKFNSVNVSK